MSSTVPRCQFQGNGQGKNKTFDCQMYPLLQAHLDRWDTDNHRIENYSVTEHHVHSGNWNWRSGLIFYLYSWEAIEGSLMSGEMHFPNVG